jgi:hypothetical protein
VGSVQVAGSNRVEQWQPKEQTHPSTPKRMVWRTPMEFFSFFSQLWIFMTWDFLLSPLFWDFLYSTVKTLYTRVCSNPKKGKWGAKEEDAEGSIDKPPNLLFLLWCEINFLFFSPLFFQSLKVSGGEVRGTFFLSEFTSSSFYLIYKRSKVI